MSVPLLQVQSICKNFETAQGDLNAIRSISFSVAPGEFVCIVGPSGSGKSTLLQILAGLLPPTKGRVLLAGQPLLQPPADISLVFQRPNLMPWRTVLENVKLPLQIVGMANGEAAFKAQSALEMVGLSDFAQAYPKELSGGMEQRVAVARALVQQPRILLLDEPFGALDALTRERLNHEILDLWQKQQLTAIMVTHNIHEAVFLADRVMVLSPRPATIAADFNIDLPRPRPEGIEYSEIFGSIAYQIRQAIQA